MHIFWIWPPILRFTNYFIETPEQQREIYEKEDSKKEDGHNEIKDAVYNEQNEERNKRTKSKSLTIRMRSTESGVQKYRKKWRERCSREWANERGWTAESFSSRGPEAFTIIFLSILSKSFLGIFLTASVFRASGLSVNLSLQSRAAVSWFEGAHNWFQWHIYVSCFYSIIYIFVDTFTRICSNAFVPRTSTYSLFMVLHTRFPWTWDPPIHNTVDIPFKLEWKLNRLKLNVFC